MKDGGFWEGSKIIDIDGGGIVVSMCVFGPLSADKNRNVKNRIEIRVYGCNGGCGGGVPSG